MAKLPKKGKISINLFKLQLQRDWIIDLSDYNLASELEENIIFVNQLQSVKL